MNLGLSLLLLAALIVAAAFFSISEIALAASRRLRLKQMADDGDLRAEKVLRVQEQPGHYFTVVQIAVNALAILGGIVGEGMLSGYATDLFARWMPAATAATLGFLASFLLITSTFIILTDLIPKQVGMAEPERFAVRVIEIMRFLMKVFKPFVWFYSRLSEVLIRLLGLPYQRDDRVTSDDILALAEAGARSGALAWGEQQVIENVFELDTRTVPSAMTQRDRIAWFHLDEQEDIIRARIAAEPYATYPVCKGDLDHVIGYVDARVLFQRLLNSQSISLQNQSLIQKVLVIPDRLTLAEVLAQFRQAGEDFAVIVNEYSLVVGVVTLNDVMSTVMGDLVSPWDEEQIIRRDENSWLIDGAAPIQDVCRMLEIDDILVEDDYETLAGFLMTMLRRIPRRTDTVSWGGYTFEVLDVDTYRVDQVLASRIASEQAAKPGV
ncbi:hemolysin family protein [Pollutimonas harenae]|uniref:Polyamine export protein n=1 Tax=Pollutimonas harenae TaxID=657015 RepID=A0A853GUI3_9BURK|nr:hemolysin family protein [Pollutimonas harenae]NYT86838.1 HlyC/CorC family transporter [Pollutimonas harenae]TEA71481.1 HlyC/CorC family transporter [Pollutimonas harenae]